MDFIITIRGLAENLGAVILLAFLFGLTSRNLVRAPVAHRAITFGLLFGLLAITAMIMPLSLAGGSAIDLGKVIVMTAAPFGGVTAGLIAGICAGAFRWSLGGAELAADTAAILIATLFGCLIGWRQGRLHALGASALAGLMLALLTLPTLLLLPEPAQVAETFRRLALPTLAGYPLGAVLLVALLSLGIRRVEIETALQESQKRFRDIAEIASDWFWEMGPDLRFTYVSPAFARVLGYPVETWLGKRRQDVVKDHGAAIGKHLEDLAARRPFRNFRYRASHADGSHRHISISGTPVFDEAGVFMGYRGSGTDITAEVTARRELEEAQRNAEAASRSKSAFLANMSHELRTPLNAILGFSQIMQEERLGPVGVPTYREYAADINESGQFLLQLINDLLDLSKIEAGRFELYPERVGLDDLFQSATRMLRQQAEERGLELSVEIVEPAQALHVDYRAMRQVLLNLLSNAIKYSDAGGKVRLEARIDPDGAVTIAVKDTGRGIAKEDLGSITEPFIQADNTKRVDDVGTGLGLPLAKALLELHGGRLVLESELGKGTTAHIHLPADRRVDPDAEVKRSAA